MLTKKQALGVDGVSFRAPSILVFDSGFGGLSVASEIRYLIPTLQINYFADRIEFPYGLKTPNQIKQRVCYAIGQCIEKLLPEEVPDIIVIACNTASTLCLDILRRTYPDIMFVGVVPAIKPAARLTKTSAIGVLATQATIDNPYTTKLIDEYAQDCEVILYGSKALATIAEQKIAGHVVCHDQLLQEIRSLENVASPKINHDSGFDYIVLACTHFPLLKHELAQCCAYKYKFIDSGQAIARRVDSLLTPSRHHLLAKLSTPPESKVVISSPTNINNTQKNNIEKWLGSRSSIILLS